jgi:hypothetical protein
VSLSGLFQFKSEGFRGPAPSFDRAHVLFAFLTIGAAGSIGRQALAKQTGLGEGAIRTVLKRLKEEDYVESDSAGCSLTRSGSRLYGSVSKKISPMVDVTGSELTVGKSQVALVVRSGGRGVRYGIEQRDTAIRVGAAGATTYVIKSGKFAIPGGSADSEKDYPSESWGTLRSELQPKGGDAVIVCGAGDANTARIGCLAAALSLI